MRLQAEHPAEQDLFEGESHKNVAIKMAGVIENAGISIVGLEGDLGSGKSTIIGLLKKELDKTHSFITFDAEKYHHGTTKKALIEVIYDGIKKTKPRNVEKLTDHKDKALGNVFTYSKNVKSRISWFTVLFIIFSIFSAQSIRYALHDLNAYLIEPDKISLKTLIAEWIAVSSPLLLVLFLSVANFFKKERFISLGDLFKKNSDDTITEKLLVNREVGAIELTEALRGFSASDVLYDNQKFVLVIDNLDRVSPEKVKELGSDMELICGAANGSFKIIVPYSARHVAAALKIEGSNGYEFISKRLPVNFTVPPLITAGWQEVFIKYWTETVSSNIQDAKEVIRIIERWLPDYYEKITPRLLKKLVNDIHVLSLTVGEHNHRHVLIAMYLFFTRYNSHNLKTLVSNPEMLAESDKSTSLFISKLKETHTQLSALFPHSEQGWSEYIISVHYQSDINIARSELIDEPLLTAIKDLRTDAVEELASIWGFSSAWERCLTRLDLVNWVIVLSRMVGHLDNLSTEIKQTILVCNRSLYSGIDFSINRSLSEAIYSLYKSKIFDKEPFMDLRKQKLIDKLDQMHESGEFDPDIITDVLLETNIYSDIYSTNILADELKYYVDGELFVQHLADHVDDYPYLSIDKLELNTDEKKSALRFIMEGSANINLLHPMMTGQINCGFVSLLKFDTDESAVPDYADQIMSLFKEGTAISSFVDFELLILHPEWRTGDLTALYGYQTDFMNDDPEHFCAHLIAHMISVKSFKGMTLIPEISDKEKFNDILFNYLRWQFSFSRVIDSLKELQLRDYILPAFSRLMEQNNIYSMDVLRYITTDYTLLYGLVQNINLMLPLTNRTEHLEKHLNETKLEVLSLAFLKDIKDSADFLSFIPKIMKKALEVAQSEISLTEFLTKPHKNTEYVLFNYSVDDKDIFSVIDAKVFSGWFKNTDNNSLSMNARIRTIYSALPQRIQEEVVSNLSDLLYDRSVDSARRISLIHCFGQELNYKEADRNEPRRTIAALYPESVSDEHLSSWLDQQDLSFSKWPNEDVNTAMDIILNNQELFPLTCRKSRFVANRIKDFANIIENKSITDATEEGPPTARE